MGRSNAVSSTLNLKPKIPQSKLGRFFSYVIGLRRRPKLRAIPDGFLGLDMSASAVSGLELRTQDLSLKHKSLRVPQPCLWNLNCF